MKILFFSKLFPRTGNDAQGSYIYDQINEIALAGNEVLVVSPHMYIPRICGLLGGKFKKYAEMPTEYEYRGLKVLSPRCLWFKELFNGTPEFKFWLFKFLLHGYLDRLCESFRPDILYSMDPLLDGRLCTETGKKQDIPVVLIEHSVPGNYRKLLGRRRTIDKFRKYMCRADGLMFVSHRQKEQFEAILNCKMDGRVITNGYRNENMDGAGKTKSGAGEIVRLISIGFLEDRKGYPTTFRVVKKLWENGCQGELTILGDGYERERYQALVQKMGIEKVCHFKGLVSHQEVYKYLSESDIYVLPSYDEAFGISYLEAMSCGIPVIGTENEGISDIVDDGVNGFLVKRNDADRIAELVIRLMSDRNLYERISAEGRNTVENLTWGKNARDTVEYFQEKI